MKLSFNSLRNPIFDRDAKDNGVLVEILIGVLLRTAISICMLVDVVGSEWSDCNSIADASIVSDAFFDPVHLMN